MIGKTTYVALRFPCATVEMLMLETKIDENIYSGVVHFPPQTLIPKWETTLFLEMCCPPRAAYRDSSKFYGSMLDLFEYNVSLQP